MPAATSPPAKIKPPGKAKPVLLDPPTSLAAELQNRWNNYQNAQLLSPPNPTMVALTLNLLNKTLDKCSIELGRPTMPRPTVVPQGDGTLKLEYPA